MYHHNPKDTMSSAFSRTGFVVICLTLVVNLALYPVLRTLGFQIHSAITGSYVPGYHSVLLINCPTEQTARDIGSLSKRANFLKELIALKSEVCYDWPVNQCVVIGRILQACDGYVTSLTISGTSDSNASVTFRGIMEKRLAACVNIFPRTATMYYWKGEIRNASEILLLVRTRTSLVQRLEAYLRAVHPYDIPEIISFPIGDGSLNYLKWMENALIDI